MTMLDPEATFMRLDKLRERMERLEKAPVESEWQFTRQLIRALMESIAKSKRISAPVGRKVRVDAPAPVSGDWRELIEVLEKKGINSESRGASLKRARAASRR